MERGAFQIARKTFDSEIWLKKPSTWFKIWVYIVGKVNHKDNKQFKRGEGFFNFSEEKRKIGFDITYDTIKHCLTCFRKFEMIDTIRSTRGVIIKVLKYDTYQTLDNYGSTIPSTREAREKHERSTTINKNDKNDKNDKNIDSPILKEVFDYWNKQSIISHRILSDKIKSKITAVLKNYSIDDIKQSISNYAKVLKEDCYFWTYRWTLEEFLQRGMVKFLETPLDNFLKKGVEKERPFNSHFN